jgi:hypothetical protein
MLVIEAEGELEDLQRAVMLPSVLLLSRGVTPSGGNRYRAVVTSEESAIPQIEALGCIVTVIATQEQMDSPPPPDE